METDSFSGTAVTRADYPHVEVDCESPVNTKQRKNYRIRKRRWQSMRFLVLTVVFSVCYLCVIVFTSLNFGSKSTNVQSKLLFFDTDSRTLHRRLLSTSATTESPNNTSTVTPTTTSSSLNYPRDLFTETQLKQGAVILHFLGVIYMFVALAIVCDEFFVPSLEVITERLHLSEDVAGATFMAAGGSAPELFTSFIGTFISGDNVGIGTIVGSAVFNILFVIGMCAIVSKTVLALTWWPLFRDVSFYSLSLLVLIGTFNDGQIQWWEALLLLLCYAAYVIFMKFNHQVENAFKSKLMKNRVTTVRSTDNLIEEQKMQRRCSVPILHAGGNKFRHGVLQLMIHTIDPLGEGKVQEKAIQMHAVASLKVLMNPENGAVHEPNHNSKNGSITAISNGQLQTDNIRTHSNHSQESQQTTLSVGGNADEQEVVSQRTVNSVFVTAGGTPPLPPVQYTDTNSVSSDAKSQKEDLENESEPLDISWPDTARKRIIYILIFPIIFPLWLCLPDVRRPEKAKFFPWTFIGSIIAIAVFSYLMNWWGAVVGTTAGIQPEIMGLTILAAGTSVPDLITSVIVAKKGYGDMAVSSSVGSNIFDVTMGLPLPWFLWSVTHNLKPNSVLSAGLFCSIILLFIMLMLVIVCIAAFKWKMNKAMGGCMFAMYLVFLLIAVLLEFNIIICPVGG